MATFTTLEEVKAYTNGSLFDDNELKFRPEQEDAIEQAKKKFCTKEGRGDDVKWTVKPTASQFLWNAKMRFGKTVCALQLAKEMGVKRILIVTHRPVVEQSWLEDFYNICTKDTFANRKVARPGNYAFGTRVDDKNGANTGNFYDLEKFVNESDDNHYVFFVSMQYLRLSALVNEKAENKQKKNGVNLWGDTDNENEKLKEDILNNKWDLVVIDEAHEGTRTALGKRVIDEYLKKGATKVLQLSGTPFNLYDDFTDDEIYTWDYTKEQKSKREWSNNHPGEKNPYEELPRMNFFRYDLAKTFRQFLEEGGTNFKFSEFFRTWTGNPKSDGKQMPSAEFKGKFIHEEDVISFLDLLCKKDDANNFPFSTDEYRRNFRHTLWVVPGVKEAKAMAELLRSHRIFRRFNVINVAGDGDEDESNNALDAVKNAIGQDPEKTSTITLSCGRLTTGVTVKPWTAVLYMKGSENTSAATYMQTIFRVQSPYTTRGGRYKTECYVFDFAPMRQLKMVAETAKFASLTQKEKGAATLTTKARDIENMNEFMQYSNFICLDEGAMDKVDAEALFGQLQHVYVDRVVRNGYNDNSLYDVNALLSLSGEEIKELNELGEIIEKTTNMDSPQKASNINLDNLTPEERQKIEEAKKKQAEARRNGKKAVNLTEEEKALLEKERKEKEAKRKERDNRITILRGISLRIPLLIYGADMENEDEEININNFTQLVDGPSWEEFMPRGVTKAKFNAFRKCYNPAIFTAAGKRIRELVRQADEMHVHERIKRIAEIFGFFHNPDKETVLTPWRVVNMHMSDTLGGYCFFNEKFDGPNQKEIVDENGNVNVVDTNEPRLVDNGEITSKLFREIDPETNNLDSKILEINSKTGLYPLYVVYSLFRIRLEAYCKAQVLDHKLENISVEEEQVIWDDVVANNMFVICNTSMAEHITKRTLRGFRKNNNGEELKDNIKTEKLTDQVINNQPGLARNINQKRFWNGNKLDKNIMKFDAIVGNPPYQSMTNANGIQAVPIYHHFTNLAKSINPNLISFITPSRWFAGGMGLDEYRASMMQDMHISYICDFSNSKDCFPSISISGGVSYFLWNKNYSGECLFKNFSGNSVSETIRPLNEFSVLVRYNKAVSIIHKISKITSENLVNQVSSISPFGLASNYRGCNNSTVNSHVLYTSEGIRFAPNEDITRGTEWLNVYKVLVSQTGAEHAMEPSKDGTYKVLTSTMAVLEKSDVCTHSYILVGKYATKEEAIHLYNYLKTKFVRFLLLQSVSSIHISKSTFQFVPNQDFSRDWTDDDLYAKYDLDMFERAYIESLIKPME